MKWNKELTDYWIANYHALRDYELNPFERVGVFLGEPYITGSVPQDANFVETCDFNWEFDRALKRLGDKESLFRELYLKGNGENEELYNKFCQLLKEEHGEED